MHYNSELVFYSIIISQHRPFDPSFPPPASSEPSPPSSSFAPARHAKSGKNSASENLLASNFRKKTRTFVCVISCLCCVFYILVTRIAINGIFETIPQTFGLISTLKMVFLIDFLKFLVISSSKFPHSPKSSASGARAACVFLQVCNNSTGNISTVVEV